MLLEPLRHHENPDFGVVIFRRVSTQITAEGGLWDTALQMYIPLGISYKTQPYQITFKSGAKITFSHLQYEKDAYSYQGSQIPLICFDELTHFTENQFFYLLSRNRSMCGIKPYIRATCNPDADSWVKQFIQWWIDEDSGLPIRERDGVVRYFFRDSGEIIWGDTREELMKTYHMNDYEIKSATFIHASVYDNKILLETNPEYLGSLKALSAVEQGRLLQGNWNIRPSGGMYYKANQVAVVDALPSKIVSIARAWDLAGTEISDTNKDPDRTASVLMAKLDNGMYAVLDVTNDALSVEKVRQRIRSKAQIDRGIYGAATRIHVPQDPGQAGKAQAKDIKRELAGFSVFTDIVTGNKITRTEPFSVQWQSGNVVLMRGEWNDMYLLQMEGFPEATHDDMVDASSDAFNMVANYGGWGVYS